MMHGSWKTSLIGLLGGVMTYLVQLGPNLPTDGKGWGVVLVSAFLTALGLASKDSNVSNSPAPVSAQAVSLNNEAKANPAAK